MKVAALPFNSPQGAQAPLGRQMVNFICDNLRILSGIEIGMVTLMMEVEEPDGKKKAQVNLGDDLPEPDFIRQFFEQGDVSVLMDGLLTGSVEEGMELHARIHVGDKTGWETDDLYFSKAEMAQDGIFRTLEDLMTKLAQRSGVELEPDRQLDYGTDDPMVFIKFLQGYDSVLYVQQAQGQVPSEFSPESAIQTLLEAAKADPEFLGPYETLVHFCQLCARARLGTLPMVESALRELMQIEPNDFRAYAALAEILNVNQRSGDAATLYEKAIQLGPSNPALYTNLAAVQMALKMPANAEKNLRMAVDLEGEDKPSLDFLAQVLTQTGRAHEVPPLWREVVQANPQNPVARVKLAWSLFNSGQSDAAEETFEKALAEVEDTTPVKRFYAPVLAKKGELDRAMDFYEDCIDATPTDVPLLLEYAHTLKEAGREFEVPDVLRNVLKCEPDRNTQANTQAWLLELTQNKRTDVVEEARQKIDSGDVEGAIRLLKPLRNWLADYWKLWALLATAYNRVNEPKEAEDAARRLIDLFPACEPAYGELAGALGAQERHDEAYHVMRMAAEALPHSLPTILNLALAAKRVGKDEEARQIARSIREAVPGNKEIEEILAQIER